MIPTFFMFWWTKYWTKNIQNIPNERSELGMTFELVNGQMCVGFCPKTKFCLVTTDFHFMCRCYRLNNHRGHEWGNKKNIEF